MARPTGDLPLINAPTISKWSTHFSRRGLNKGTTVLLSGSTAERFVPLCRLQRLHAQARLESSSAPRCCRAMMCSTWKGPVTSIRSGKRQYSHRPARRVHGPAAGVLATSTRFSADELLSRFELKRGNHVTDFNQRVILVFFFWRKRSFFRFHAQFLHPSAGQFILAQLTHCLGCLPTHL